MTKRLSDWVLYLIRNGNKKLTFISERSVRIWGIGGGIGFGFWLALALALALAGFVV